MTAKSCTSHTSGVTGNGMITLTDPPVRTNLGEIHGTP